MIPQTGLFRPSAVRFDCNETCKWVYFKTNCVIAGQVACASSETFSVKVQILLLLNINLIIIKRTYCSLLDIYYVYDDYYYVGIDELNPNMVTVLGLCDHRQRFSQFLFRKALFISQLP